MGKVYHKIVRSSIPNAETIGCVVAADHLVVASVSNWGGYALSAAAGVLQYQSLKGSSSTVEEKPLTEYLNSFLPTDVDEMRMCTRMVEAGARDGTNGLQQCMVDGMPLSASLDILRSLRNLDFSSR